jgi:hypothetical protein
MKKELLPERGGLILDPIEFIHYSTGLHLLPQVNQQPVQYLAPWRARLEADHDY